MMKSVGLVGSVLLCTFGSIRSDAQPFVTAAQASIAGDNRQLDLSLDSPITVFPVPVRDNGLDVVLTFSEPLSALENPTIDGATAFAFIDSADARRVVFPGVRVVDGTVQTFSIGRVANSTGGVTRGAGVTFGVLGGDYRADGRLDFFDVVEFLRLFDSAEMFTDLTGDSVLSIADEFALLGRIESGSLIPNSPPSIRGRDSVFVPSGGMVPPLIFDLRDDFSSASDLMLSIASAEPELVSVAGAVIELAGDQSRVVLPEAVGSVGATTLTLTADDGTASTSTSVAVRVGIDQPPSARIHAPQYVGVAPLDIRLDGTASRDGEGPIVSYEWSIGSATATGPVVDGVLATPGEYPVTLVVTDTGGLTSMVTTTISVAAAPWRPSATVTEAEARRFLWQAAWGASADDVQFVMANGFEAWIDAQQTTAGTYYTPARMDAFETALSALQGLSPDEIDQESLVYQLFDDFCVAGSDQLRQRTAWALLQVIPIAPNFDAGYHGDIAELYNLYLRASMPEPAVGATGNYFDLLSAVTYTGAMGDWLTYKGNRRADPVLGISPDENYAREIMQLFTIGLFELNPDGSRRLDAFGEPIPTYDNETVKQFARVFTGLSDGNRFGPELTPGPMRIVAADHEPGAKQLTSYPGAVPPNGLIPAVGAATSATVQSDIQLAILNLFNHPSHAPFIAELMIKRFTSSNPTPAYIQRVAEAYSGLGPYGRGVRGDVAAMVKAILLDDEARNPTYRSNPFYGRVLEPMQVYLGVARSLDMIHRGATLGVRTRLTPAFGIRETTRQAFFLTPSVFNFYLPTYAPPGSEIANAGMTTPEMQIFDEFTAVAGLVTMADQLEAALLESGPLTLSQLQDTTADPAGMASIMAAALDHGWSSTRTRGEIATGISAIEFPEGRLFAAILLAIGHPEFRVLR
ncbi:MAG: DUF1800 family protein [Planctomycetota bacterium]